MSADKRPVCYIVAGPNGAGKTTFALQYLPRIVSCNNFINADEIAKRIGDWLIRRKPFPNTYLQARFIVGRTFRRR